MKHLHSIKNGCIDIMDFFRRIGEEFMRVFGQSLHLIGITGKGDCI